MNTVGDAWTYMERGWAVLRLPYRSKKPTQKAWPSLRIDSHTFAEHFGEGPMNVGVILGEPSGNLARVDLDWPEAVTVARLLLPPTDLVMGRPSNPESGYFYRVPNGLEGSESHKDPTFEGDDAMIVELLWTGKQTVVPPSVHPEGETYRWFRDGEPAEVAADALVRAVRWVAATALLARHWPNGARHEAALALSGGLLSDGLDLDDAELLLRAVLVAAGDEEVEDRIRALHDTAQQIEIGRHVRGWRALAD